MPCQCMLVKIISAAMLSLLSWCSTIAYRLTITFGSQPSPTINWAHTHQHPTLASASRAQMVRFRCQTELLGMRKRVLAPCRAKSTAPGPFVSVRSLAASGCHTMHQQHVRGPGQPPCDFQRSGGCYPKWP